MTQFYTYLHCKPDLTPFYVGKGQGKRSHNFKNRNKHHKRIVAKYGAANIHVIIFKKDSEEAAFTAEKRLVKMLRNAGFTLANQSDGGVGGTSGHKPSVETKEKLSRLAMGNKRTLGKKLPPRTPEHCAKISKAKKGKIPSQKCSDAALKVNIGHKYNLGRKASSETRRKISMGHAKLTEKSVIEIRAILENGKKYPERHPYHVTHAMIAKLYGVAIGTIGAIAIRNTWRYL